MTTFDKHLINLQSHKPIFRARARSLKYAHLRIALQTREDGIPIKNRNERGLRKLGSFVKNIQSAMQVEISLRNKHKLPYLLELLRSLDFVESVNVQPDLSTNAPTEPSLFDRFYGKAQTGQSIEQLDEKLKELRNGWTRDF